MKHNAFDSIDSSSRVGAVYSVTRMDNAAAGEWLRWVAAPKLSQNPCRARLRLLRGPDDPGTAIYGDTAAVLFCGRPRNHEGMHTNPARITREDGSAGPYEWAEDEQERYDPEWHL